MTQRVVIDLENPDLRLLEQIASDVRGTDKIVGFPTETVYGLGGDASVAGVPEKLYALKGRDENKPFAYHLGDFEQVDRLSFAKTPEYKFLSRFFWPGPLTIVAPNKGGDKIGLRFPDNLATTHLIHLCEVPFLGTSANLSGDAPATTADEVAASFEGKIDYLIDTGPAKLKESSTVVDISQSPPKVLREGAKAYLIEGAIEKIMSGNFPRKHILFVCMGNSCRSPMAEGWMRSELMRHSLDEAIQVSSCGVGTRGGSPASMESVLVMKNREIDITDHRSRMCDRDMVVNADMIVVMGEEHAHFITSMVPAAAAKIINLHVGDPVGLSIQTYEETFVQIENKLKQHWEALIG